MQSIPEHDWKVFKPLYDLAAERMKGAILQEIAALINDDTKAIDERYYAMYRTVRERDKDLGFAFDGFSRSRATMQLLWMRRHQLITEEEFSRFSDETKNYIDAIINMHF